MEGFSDCRKPHLLSTIGYSGFAITSEARTLVAVFGDHGEALRMRGVLVERAIAIIRSAKSEFARHVLDPRRWMDLRAQVHMILLASVSWRLSLCASASPR